MQLTAAERLWPLGDGPVLQLGRAATQQSLGHQISRPWPSLISTAIRAMAKHGQTSIQPLGMGVEPIFGQASLGISVGSSMEGAAMVND